MTTKERSGAALNGPQSVKQTLHVNTEQAREPYSLATEKWLFGHEPLDRDAVCATPESCCGGYVYPDPNGCVVKSCDCPAGRMIRVREAAKAAGINPNLLYFPALKMENAEHLAKVEKLERWALNWRRGDRGWFLYGSPGSGKTTLCMRLQLYFIERHVSVLSINLADLVGKIRDGYADRSLPRESAIIDQLKSVDLLLIDDIAAESGDPELPARLLEQILDKHQGTLLSTSNRTPQQIAERYGVRVSSRLKGKLDSLLLRTQRDFREEVD